MKKIKEKLGKMWTAMLALGMAIVAWGITSVNEISNRWRNRNTQYAISDLGEVVEIRHHWPDNMKPKKTVKHQRRVIPFLVIIIVICWANKEGFFKGYPGLQSLVDMLIYVIDQFCQFVTKMVTSLVEHFKIPQHWGNFQTWFWTHWFF